MYRNILYHVMKAAAAAAVGGGEGGGGKKGQALKVLAERAAFWLRRPLFSARALLLKQRQFYKTNDKIASCLLLLRLLLCTFHIALLSLFLFLSFLIPCIFSLLFPSAELSV